MTQLASLNDQRRDFLTPSENTGVNVEDMALTERIAKQNLGKEETTDGQVSTMTMTPNKNQNTKAALLL